MTLTPHELSQALTCLERLKKTGEDQVIPQPKLPSAVTLWRQRKKAGLPGKYGK